MSRGHLHGGPDPLAPRPQCAPGEPHQPTAGAHRGLEEVGQPAGQGPRKRWVWGSARASRPPTGQKPPSQGSFLIPCTEYKRARHEIKKKSSDTLKLQKKARKGRAQSWPTEAQPHGAPLCIPRRPVGHPRASSWPEGSYPAHRTLQPVGWGRGSTLHPRPDPGPPLPGRQQEANRPRHPQTPPPPTPRSGSVHPAVFHTFFLSLSLLSSPRPNPSCRATW